jgi:DNA repair exonuclease SbcCD ATPase subunit
MAATVAPRSQWDNETLGRLRTCLQEFEKNPRALSELLAQLESELEEFWLEYLQEFDAPASTLEAAGNELLQQSYQDWRLALDALRRGDFDRGLEVACGANRLLSVLSRVEEQK